MKKVGIVTLCGHTNYGNKLQNYALQETIKKLGFNVETIWNDDCTKLEKIKRKVKVFIKYLLSVFNLFNTKNLMKRYSNFVKFSNNIIKSKFSMTTDSDNRKLNKEYDYFVVGSDQIWNYTFGITGKDFLDFSSYDKNIAYAPSLGVNVISEEYKKFYIDNLKNIKYLSCREEKGAKIISDLTGKKCEVVLDPTMLLDRNEWDKVIIKPKNMTEKKYILLYFLGEKTQYNEELKKITNDYEIIDLFDINSIYYTYGPSEFLYLIKNAEFVCTDSFHACVFSIIFKTPFVIFDRVQNNILSMNSRIDTLLSTFKLEKCKFSGKLDKSLLNCDFDESHNILNKLKEESIKYLENSLNN